MAKKIRIWQLSGMTAISVSGTLWASGLPANAVAAPLANAAPSVERLLSSTPAAKDVFVATENREARHLQSGLVCPLAFPKMNLWHLQVFGSANGLGTDVGCDYGRQGADKLWRAKLTIYAVKTGPQDTVDAAFERYKAEVTRAYPTAKILGPSLSFDGAPPTDMQNVRSEAYEIAYEGKSYKSVLIVALKAGWVIEIRGSSPLVGADDAEASMLADDTANPTRALIQALSSISQVSAP